MPKTLQLIKKTILQTWSYRGSLVPIVLIIMLPLVALNLLSSNDQTFGTYGSFATLIMNSAIIWTVIKLKTGTKHISIADAYYSGTKNFVAFMCIIGLLGLQMIPLLIGGLIYLSGSTGATVGLGPVEMILLGGIWLLFALPTLRWLVRSVFALYFVQDSGVRPIAAARQSSALVKGRGWRTFGYMLAGTVLLVIILIIPSLAISTLPESAGWWLKIATSLLQIFSALILVPFSAVYGYNILEVLGGKPKAS